MEEIQVKTEVFCIVQIEGLHNWPACPFEEVKYLRDLHRHVFHIKAFKVVNHDDRDVEFIMMKHEITKYFFNKYWDFHTKVHRFGAMSCEMIGRELINKFQLSRVEVSEDGENGAIVSAIPTITISDPANAFSQYPAWFNKELYDQWLKTFSKPVEPELEKVELSFKNFHD